MVSSTTTVDVRTPATVSGAVTSSATVGVRTPAAASGAVTASTTVGVRTAAVASSAVVASTTVGVRTPAVAAAGVTVATTVGVRTPAAASPTISGGLYLFTGTGYKNVDLYQWNGTGHVPILVQPKPSTPAPAVPLYATVSVGVRTPASPSSSTPGAWSATNLPWADLTEAQYLATLDTQVPIVDLASGYSDFYAAVQATMNAAGQSYAMIRLPDSPTTGGVFRLNQFRMIGTSGDPLYAKSLYHPEMLGFLGKGVTKTVIQQDANSTMPAGALTAMQSLTTASNYELQLGTMRIDGLQPGLPATMVGLTLRGADQAPLTSVYSDVPAVTPQPAPYNGLSFFAGSTYQVSHVRLQAFAHAMTSRGPFELGNIKSQRCFGTMRNVESDGRLSADIDPAQPRRCTVVMLNDEGSHTLTDFWGHHTNVSRYAANDQTQSYGTAGRYATTRTRFDHIADLQNTDPAQNGGVSLDGYSDPSCMGWESTSATITLTDPYLEQDNSHQTRNNPCHISLTTTAGNTAGKLYIYRGTFRNVGFPTVDNYLSMKVASSTAWYQQGLVNTVFVYNAAGGRKTPVEVTAWPPTSAQIAGTSPDTHYFVKTN